jgi:MFS family permease
LIEVLQWTTLNSAVALVGYYFAAFTIDRAWMGRKRMQVMGFSITAMLFLICGTAYNSLIKPQYIQLFQFMYYFSSFAGQWGPNATTWLLPAEMMPTEVRSACHGFSAAVGKAGALVAGVVFSIASNQAKFLISAVCGIISVICTLLFIPNLAGLDLKDGDRRWLAIVEGKASAYKGEAVNPAHLSALEIMLGYGRDYQPDAAWSGSVDARACEFPQLQGGSHTAPAPPALCEMQATASAHITHF